MTREAELRRTCTRCSQPLPASQRSVAPYLASTCTSCGYRNAVGVTAPLRLPLGEMLQRCGLEARALLQGATGGAALLEKCLRALAEPIRASIGADPELHAAATRMALEAHVAEDATQESEPGQQTIYRSASGRVLSVFYLETVRRTVFDIDHATEISQRDRALDYWRTVQGPLSDFATLGSYWLAAKQGLQDVAVGEDGFATLAPSRVGLAYAEWAWNRPPSRMTEDDKAWLTQIAQAVKRYRGYGPFDVIRLVGRRVPERRPQWLNAVTLAPADARALAGHSLTLERVESLDWPWFYDLAPRGAGRTPADVLFSVATHNWLAYFPLLPTRSQGHDGFLTFDLWMDVFTNNLVSSKSRLLEDMCHQPDETVEGDAGMKELRRLRGTLNRLLEEQVAAQMAAGGWTTGPAKTYKGDGVKEEIDVLAVSSTVAGGLVLVIEAKDYDFRLSSARGPESMQDRADKAQAQARRKADFVRENPDVLRDVVGGAHQDGPRVVLPLIVTREELPLAMFTRVYAVAVNSLSTLLRSLHDSPSLALDMLTRGPRATG